MVRDHRKNGDCSDVIMAGGVTKKEASKKKAARFPGRPFLSYGSLTFKRAISECRFRGPISRLILIGSRCLPGQSRTVAQSVAVVSHLRKMTLLSHRPI